MVAIKPLNVAQIQQLSLTYKGYYISSMANTLRLSIPLCILFLRAENAEAANNKLNPSLPVNYVIKSAEHKVEILSSVVDPAAVVPAVVDTVEDVLRVSVRDVITLDDLEIRRGQDYGCGAKGYMSGVNGLQLLDKVVENTYTGNSVIKITYTYRKLYFKYLIFGQYTPWVPKRFGSCDLWFKGIKFNLIISNPTVKELRMRIQNNQCFLKVVSLQVVELDNEGGYLVMLSRFRVKHSTKMLNKLIVANKNHFMKLIEKRVKAEVYRSLADSGSWVCLDEDLISVINKNPQVDSKTGTSKDFDRYCPVYNINK